MSYPILLTLHLLAALLFIGTVLYEVLILEALRRQVPTAAMRLLEQGVGRRARRLMPWVLLVLFGAGLGMLGLRYLPVLATPLASGFATLLSLKLILAASVLGHFLLAMGWFHSGRMTARRMAYIHLSVFVQVLLIAVLAKAMFYVSW